MRLHRLSITAFGPFADRQDVNFDALAGAGLYLLHGPTGAGKTSVLDAVCYALYGAVPGTRQGPGTTLRSDHAATGVPTEVVLELTVAGRRLEITRLPAQQRPKKGGRSGFTTEKAQSRLREYDPGEGTWRGLSRSHQEVGEEIGQLLGMSREQFCQVVLLPQGDFARFLRADAEARGKLLGRLFDTRRFAAVEERLAELRRAAEHQVRAGDERLLGIAQRMAQAARGAEVPPLPDRQPGDPALAPDLLVWAAVGRSSARERADIAEVALTAATGRQAAARQTLDEARELARAQERYDETARRARELGTRRAEHEQTQARLDLARRADRVAPALGLRDDAERAHAAAADEHDHARTRLPAGLSGAGAEQLASMERAMRQELGALEAARGAERRSAEISEARAELERQARADDEVLQETADWLSHWDGERRALRDRIEDAQEAITRAEQLAGELVPVRERLDAARRRDGLEATVSAAWERLNVAREQANTAHETWLELRERRLRGMAAELAAGLAEGEPCAVCGSTEHPDPAPALKGQVDAAAEEAALAASQRAGELRELADREYASAREAHAVARAAAGQSTVEEILGLTAQLEIEHTVAFDIAAGMHAAREALGRAERERDERLAAQQFTERTIAARTSRREALEAEQNALQVELVRARGEAGSVAERVAQLGERAGRLAEAAQAVREFEHTAHQLKEADDRLADAAFRAGFDTPREAAAALLGDTDRRAFQQRVDAYQAEAAAVADRLAEPDTRAAGGRPPAVTEAARRAHAESERALRETASVRAAAIDRREELDRLSREAEREIRELAPTREEYNRVARLAALTAGTSTDNERRMRLESYVLAARLEQVAKAATARLHRMSSGRYALIHSDARTGGQRRSGLGLQVVDAWTGSARDTATLSGGETFFVSLALALGLADVVTDEAGGAGLDTLFIDEGFGSLDDQTLDEVLDVLDSLRERDRSVGIVSHVADLRRRVPAQLEIVKERHGSSILQRDAGPAAVTG